ncbi:hypothetical protein RHSIM_Rhsim11G0170300 [Rhododendron simsii]|uniref:Uncharacterized protein n=1 Tax=Rhododendron simsii TaxID=118357 RepID=A0A834G8A2_RHOSS|nr:hypothetical protein RHSIM_Rhsim11G0170300 [Rhododendron simsii]
MDQMVGGISRVPWDAVGDGHKLPKFAMATPVPCPFLLLMAMFKEVDHSFSRLFWELNLASIFYCPSWSSF